MDFEIDLDELLLRKVKDVGGKQAEFEKLLKLISEYSRRSGAPEDAIYLLVIDSLGCGGSRESIEIQLNVYHSKIHHLIGRKYETDSR